LPAGTPDHYGAPAMARIRLILVAVLVLGAVAVWALLHGRGGPDVRAMVDGCLGAQHDVAARRASRGRAPAGEPSDAAAIARACAPLFRRPECHDAMMDFDAPPPERRVVSILNACAHAYCAVLPAPQPPACAATGSSPSELLGQWSELRAAALRLELGETEANRVLAAGGR
jgi:hypothetical protein